MTLTVWLMKELRLDMHVHYSTYALFSKVQVQVQAHITASINKRRWAVVKADRDTRWRELELDKGSFDHCLFVSDVIFSGVAVFAGRNKAFFFSSLFVCSVLFWRRDKTTWDEMRPLVWGRYLTYTNDIQLIPLELYQLYLLFRPQLSH